VHCLIDCVIVDQTAEATDCKYNVKHHAVSHSVTVVFVNCPQLDAVVKLIIIITTTIFIVLSS